MSYMFKFIKDELGLFINPAEMLMSFGQDYMPDNELLPVVNGIDFGETAEIELAFTWSEENSLMNFPEIRPYYAIMHFDGVDWKQVEALEVGRNVVIFHDAVEPTSEATEGVGAYTMYYFHSVEIELTNDAYALVKQTGAVAICSLCSLAIGESYGSTLAEMLVGGTGTRVDPEKDRYTRTMYNVVKDMALPCTDNEIKLSTVSYLHEEELATVGLFVETDTVLLYSLMYDVDWVTVMKSLCDRNLFFKPSRIKKRRVSIHSEGYMLVCNLSGLDDTFKYITSNGYGLESGIDMDIAFHYLPYEKPGYDLAISILAHVNDGFKPVSTLREGLNIVLFYEKGRTKDDSNQYLYVMEVYLGYGAVIRNFNEQKYWGSFTADGRCIASSGVVKNPSHFKSIVADISYNGDWVYENKPMIDIYGSRYNVGYYNIGDPCCDLPIQLDLHTLSKKEEKFNEIKFITASGLEWISMMDKLM